MIIPHIPFYFIRHGQTDWNHRHIYMGSIDVPLNQTGIKQAHLAAQWLKSQPITHIVTSPLSRAVETAEIIAKALKSSITVCENLKECNWGAKEGQPVDNHAFFDKWVNGETFEGAEKASDFDARVKQGLKNALELSTSVLIVGHGGVYCSIQRALSLPLVNIKNCAPAHHHPPKYPGHEWFVYDVSES